MNIYEWIASHNPDKPLEYRKGWWNYIKLIQEVMHKFDLTKNDVTVMHHYKMQTPPPTETLLMPVTQMAFPNFTVVFKYDFGHFPEQWVVSISHQQPIEFPSLENFMHPIEPIANLDGMPDEWLFEDYEPYSKRFTTMLYDSWDFVTLLRLLDGKKDKS